MNYKWLVIAAASLLPLAVLATEGLPGASVKPDAKNPTAEERSARMEACRENPEKCRAQRQAQFEKRCAENPERCKEMKAKMAKRMEQCKANPEQCHAERAAMMDKRFKSADADGNGMLSRAEAEKGMPRLARHFDRIDANKDGQVSSEEMAGARKAHFEQRGRYKPDRGAEPGKI
jgi:hypothetical protein